MRKAPAVEADDTARNQPRQDLELELACLDGRIPLCEGARFLGAGAEDVQSTESPPRLTRQRPGGEESATLVKRRQVAQVCVLKLGCRGLVQLRRIRRSEEQDDRELIELHASMLRKRLTMTLGVTSRTARV